MTDVETLHPLHFREFQHRRQSHETLMNGRLLGKFGRQRRGSVGTRQLQIAGAVTAWFGLNINASPSQFGQGICQQGFIIKIKVEQDFRWQRAHLAALQIKLTDKGLDNFAQFGATRYFWEIAAAAQHFALTNKQNVNACQPGVEGDANHIQVVAIVRHKLLLSDASHRLNLIANTRCLFKR
ncbi:hypothetical protein D3C86_1720430 [compost metagenome]